MKTFRASDGAVIFLKSIIFSLALQIVAGIILFAITLNGKMGEKGKIF